MRVWQVVLMISLAGQSIAGEAQQRQSPAPSARQLSGLDGREAADLIGKLKNAQTELKAGKSVPFELLAGSVASFDETRISPRNAFLQLPFDKVWSIQRLNSVNRLRQPYRLAYAPDGLGKPYWDIEVVLAMSGDLQRVSMMYRPPAPF